MTWLLLCCLCSCMILSERNQQLSGYRCKALCFCTMSATVNLTRFSDSGLRSCGDSDLFTWGLWREPKVVWCGPNIAFWGELPLPLSPIFQPPPPHFPVKFLLWWQHLEEMSWYVWWVFNTTRPTQWQGLHEGITATHEEQWKKKADYLLHTEYLLRHNAVKVVHFLM